MVWLCATMLFYTILPVQCASVSCLALKTDFSLDFSAEALFVYETAFLADLSQCKKTGLRIVTEIFGQTGADSCIFLCPSDVFAVENDFKYDSFCCKEYIT